MEATQIQKTDNIQLEQPTPPTNSKPPFRRNHSRAGKYRKAFTHVKTHDDLLQEHFHELVELLKDSKQPTAHSIRRDHREQTINLINDYNCVSGGCSPRGVVIPRSLPKALRSPRSTASSNCSTPRTVSGRVSRSSRRWSADSGYTYHSRETSKHRKHVSFKSDNVSNWSSGTNSQDPSPSRSPSTVLKSAAIRIEQELARRATKRTPQRHNYIQDDRELSSHESTTQSTRVRSRDGQKSNRKREEKLERPESARSERSERSIQSSQRGELQPEVRHGVKVDLDGRMRSDTDLKDTSNSQLREWAKRKDKLIRQSRKDKRVEEKKKREQEELERQKSEERKKDSKLKVKIWRAKKRAESRILKKRKLQAAAMIETAGAEKRGTPCGGENPTQKPPPPQTSSDCQPRKSQKTVKLKRPSSAHSNPDQKANTKPERPKSAPLKRVPKPSDISLLTIIENSPDLREKIKQLEKEKRLKHRQSYDEWVRAKNQERKDTLKILRERRRQLEQEISEQTAKVISEATRRRVDQIKSQYNTPVDEDVSSNAPEANAKPETKTTDEKTEPYQWKKSSEKPKNKKEVNKKSFPKPPRNIEDKINVGDENPFRASYERPKMKRPRSKLEKSGIRGAEFSRFVWELVNDEEDGGRPEPQGADSPNTPTDEQKTPAKPRSGNKPAEPLQKPTQPQPSTPKPENPHPKQATSTTKTATSPPTEQPAQSTDATQSANTEPVIENGKTIFSMTSIEA